MNDNHDEPTLDSKLLAFYESARSELLVRVTARDLIVNIFLVSSAAIVAFGSQNGSDYRALAAITVLALATSLLHAQHELLIGSLTTYCQKTGEKLRSDDWADDWANSEQEAFAAHLWIRLFGNAVVFAGIPVIAMIGATWWSTPAVPPWVTLSGFGCCALAFAVTCGIWSIRYYWFKRARAARDAKRENLEEAHALAEGDRQSKSSVG